MSDKTKFYSDQALMHRRMHEQRARDAARGDTRPRCQCGLTYLEVPIMWQVLGKDRWAPAVFCCPACLPHEYLALAARDVANLPDESSSSENP